MFFAFVKLSLRELLSNDNKRIKQLTNTVTALLLEAFPAITSMRPFKVLAYFVTATDGWSFFTLNNIYVTLVASPAFSTNTALYRITPVHAFSTTTSLVAVISILWDFAGYKVI